MSHLCVISGKLAACVLRGIAFHKCFTAHSALAGTLQGLSSPQLRCGAHHTQLVGAPPPPRIPARFANIMGKAAKRKADGEPAAEPAEDQSAAPSSSGASGLPLKVNPKRVRELKGGEIGSGPVIYWCAAHLTRGLELKRCAYRLLRWLMLPVMDCVRLNTPVCFHIYFPSWLLSLYVISHVCGDTHMLQVQDVEGPACERQLGDAVRMRAGSQEGRARGNLLQPGEPDTQ